MERDLPAVTVKRARLPCIYTNFSMSEKWIHFCWQSCKIRASENVGRAEEWQVEEERIDSGAEQISRQGD